MGIYISGVKGLPEQVQKNKEDIEQIKEDIADIDFEAIEQLEEQVEENTNDINTIENNIGLQSNAITDLQGRMTTAEGNITDLETKTQKITYDEDANDTIIDGDVIITDDLEVDNVHVAGNGTFQNANGSGLHFQEGANDDELVLSNRESGTAHYLTLHADGTLTLDGNPVGAQALYMHRISISRSGSNFFASITIINNSNTALNTYSLLRAYLYDTYGSGINSLIAATGGVYENNTYYNIIFIIASSTSLTASTQNTTNGIAHDFSIPSSALVSDNITQIA